MRPFWNMSISEGIQTGMHPDWVTEAKGGGPMRGLGSDHVISGPIGCLKINSLQGDVQTDRQTNLATTRLTQAESVKTGICH